jgi:hypothetical protein
MNRRTFLSSLIGGMAATAATRTFPFRVFSFASQIKPANFWTPGMAFLSAELEKMDPNIHEPLTSVTWLHDMDRFREDVAGIFQIPTRMLAGGRDVDTADLYDDAIKRAWRFETSNGDWPLRATGLAG